MARKADGPVLDDVELGSTIVRKLLKHLSERLDALRVSNDKPSNDEDTNLIRGRIAELKRFIKTLEK